MRFSLVCICGFETPLVDDEEDIDLDLMDIHQEDCEQAIKMNKENGEHNE